MTIEQKIFELFDSLVADFTEEEYIEICGEIEASFRIRAEG